MQLRAAGLLDRPLEVLALGGEAIDTALWEQLRALPPAVFNCYGPTEVTVEAVVAPVKQYETPTIGTANAGTFGYVLDSTLRMVPTGVVGELYLSGAQLTRGYVGRSALTASRFVADPLRPGQRMYRTGDLVRRLPHGGYAYLGRADTQVKIRGYRVEIGEIEAALRGRADVHDAAVAVVRRATGASLVGFVVWQQDADGDPVRLRAELAERLPLYMVPARIVVLPRLPVNANGKLDGHALDRLASDALSRVSADGAASASTETERTLCEVCKEQFNGVAPHIDDDFFALGLDSIVAISLVHKARRRGLVVSPRMVFTAPTIRELAAAIDEAGPETARQDGEYGEVPPLPMVSWLYEYGNYRRFTHTVLLGLPSDNRPSGNRVDAADAARRARHAAVDPDRHSRGAAPGHPRARRGSGRRRADPRAGVELDRCGVVFGHRGFRPHGHRGDRSPRGCHDAGGLVPRRRARRGAADHRAPPGGRRGVLAHHAGRYRRGMALGAIGRARRRHCRSSLPTAAGRS